MKNWTKRIARYMDNAFWTGFGAGMWLMIASKYSFVPALPWYFAFGPALLLLGGALFCVMIVGVVELVMWTAD